MGKRKKDFENMSPAELVEKLRLEKTKTPFDAALGYLHEKSTIIIGAIALLESMRDSYNLEKANLNKNQEAIGSQ